MPNAPSYDEAQAKLRKNHEGDDLHIDPPRDIPDVNPEVYKDVEPVLFRGFVHVPAEINGVLFVFKSMNHHEFEMIKLMAPATGASRKAMQKFYAHFLAYGIFMVDGVNVLQERDRHLPELVKLFEEFDERVNAKIIRHLSDINRRANRAVTLTEAFTMEVVSRLRWAQLRNTDLTSTAVTGLQGTAALGMNWGQLTWRALNYYDDLREQSEREWENAKFVASAMAGKGMSRVHNQDRRRREKEREDRIERRDKILRFALLGESMEKPETKGVTMRGPRTVEELATQLEKDLKGEKDWHDLVVESQETRAREERQQRMDHLKELQRGYDDKYGTRGVSGGTDLRGLTPEEVRQRLERHHQLEAQRLAARQVHPEMHDPRMGEFAQKWDSVSKTSRDPSEVPLIPVSNRTAGNPFRTSR